MEKLVFFDFDGVISDSFEQAYMNAKDLMEEYKMDLFSDRDGFRKLCNKNSFEMLKELGMPFWKVPGLMKRFRDISKDVAEKAELCNGIAPVIKDLAGKYKLGIVSSGVEESISYFLEMNQLRDYFDFIYGMDTDKSKVKKFKKAFKEFSIEVKDAVFITDMSGDVFESKEVGLFTIGVTWGYQTREMLNASGPDAIVDDPKKIIIIVDKRFGR